MCEEPWRWKGAEPACVRSRGAGRARDVHVGGAVALEGRGTCMCAGWGRWKGAGRSRWPGPTARPARPDRPPQPAQRPVRVTSPGTVRLPHRPANAFSRSPVVAEVSIAAEARSEFGKGAARRIRRAHQVPAVLYGHGTPPRHVSLPGHELTRALKSANVLLRLEGLDGGAALALPKAVQRDAVSGL